MSVFLLTFASTARAQTKEAELWETLKTGNSVALMRHATAPGTGDPPGFQVDDCSTQRNLDQEGREQARGIGERFRERGISKVKVYSSQWCRCLETARLLELGEVTELPDLNSFLMTVAPKKHGPQTSERLLIVIRVNYL